ncbi:MAG: Ig-like domain-containing protein [Actinomycetota bacterium]|nr:Ig-like domain-containing protein [Actinomycetota bacterium]
MVANNGPVAIDFEIDCFSGCGDAAYTTTTPNPSTAQATVSPTAPEAGVDGDQPVGTTDDIRQNSVEMTCVVSAGNSSCTVTYQRTDASAGGPGAGDIDIVAAWIDHDGSDATDESDGGETPGAEDNDNTDAVQKNWEARQAQNVDCGPATANNPTGSSHTTTCTTTDQFGQGVQGAPGPVVTSGGANTTTNCDATTNANGQGTCQMQNNGNPDTVTVRQCTVDSAAGTGNCDTQTKTFEQPTATFVDAEPENDTNTVGDQHTITVNVQNQFQGGQGTGTQGTVNQQVNFEFHQGSPAPLNNDNATNTAPDTTCTTQANQAGNGGTCSITYTSQTAGTDAVSVWVGNATPAGTNNNPTCDGEGPGQTTDPNCDVVLKTWIAGQNQAAATQIDAFPDSDTNNVGQRHDIFVIARDAAGNPTFGQATTQTATTNCNQAANAGATGACPSRVRADIQVGSPNNSQAVVTDIQCARSGQNIQNIQTGSQPAANNATHICSYVGQNPGQDSIRVFFDSNDDGQFTQGEPNEVVTKTWAGAAGSITVTPPQDDAPIGVCNTFTVTVRDPQNNPVTTTVDVRQTFQNPPAAGQPGQPNITFCTPAVGSGANPQAPTNQTPAGNLGSAPVGGGQPNTRHAEFQTDNTGQVTIGIASDTPGTVQLQFWVEATDNDVFDPQNNEPGTTATKTWTPGGQAAARNLTATPANDTNPVGTVHRITATVTNQAGQQLQGVNVAMQFSQNSANNAGQIVQCQNPTGQTGTVQCTYTGNTVGTDTIIVFVNQGGSAGPDTGEPQQQVTKTWTAAPTGLSVDLTCGGTLAGGANQPPPQGETAPQAETRRENCVNPLTDADEVFTVVVTDAANSRRSGVRVNFTVTQRTGTVTSGVNSADDVSFTGGAGTGTSAIAECDTDANGTCSVTLTNPNPQNGDAVTVRAQVAGQTNPGAATDDATKTWQSPVATNLVLTPRAATNQVNTQHTVTATIQSQFGETLTANPGVTVDFRIFAGPNNGLTQLDTQLTNGQATFTFTSPIAGTDRILACAETTAQGGGGDNDICNLGTGTGPNNAPAGGPGNEPFGEASKTWQTGAVVTGAVVLDMDADDPNAGPGSTPPGGCEVATPTDPNRERTATNTINPTSPTAGDNFHRICASAFQGQGGNQGPISGAPITFTITGVGRIFPASPQGTCATNVVPAAGTSQTVTANEQGIAFACLFSQQVGRTNVTASAGTPAVSDTGTKDWTVGTERARNIQLCHGDVAGTTCVTANQTNEPGDEHQLTARVTDVQGNPVAGVPVQFRETGPAIFTPQGGSTATVSTDANGLASVLMTSDVTGTSTVVAEILSGSGVNNARGPGATDDQCEQPAGQGGTPTAGNCISQTLTKEWAPDVIEPECDNGIDDDGDGFIDEEDPSCDSPTDDDESPVDPPPDPRRVPHDRRISIRFQDGTGARNNGLVVFGRLRVPDGFSDCLSQQPVNIQRRISGRWVTKKTTNTNRRGRYAVEIFDQASRYRAVAVRTEILDEDLNELHICRKAVKAKRHRHRR